MASLIVLGIGGVIAVRVPALDAQSTWTRPWTAVVPLQRVNEPIFEYACHEGNYALRNILAGVRAQERAR
jgi:hypothetical protein